MAKPPLTKSISILFFVLLLGSLATSQQVPEQGALPDAEKVYASLLKRSETAEQDLNEASQKYLDKLQKQEAKLQKKIWKKDSLLAKQLFEGVEDKYEALKNAPKNISKYSHVYSSRLDSLTTSLRFLGGENSLSDKASNTLSKYGDLQAKLNQTEAIRKFLNERKKLLKENLEKLGMVKELKGFSKEAYYYSQQVRELKA
ncbi:MAG: hypothetical protein EOP48_01020, partial [Sphingobacteriales bacterium]